MHLLKKCTFPIPDFQVPSTASFDPNNASHVEEIRLSLVSIVNLGFQCLSNSSGPNCTTPSGRRRRAVGPYDVKITSPITLVNKTRYCRVLFK